MSRLFFPEGVHRIIATLNNAGHEAYPVGGAVRDLIMGKDAFDYDIATSALPERVVSLFEKTIPTGIKHGTVTVLVGSCYYEVTTYRIDGFYEDGRRPNDVSFSALLEEDLKRRDFTMNALAYDLREQKVIDYFDGLGDLEKKLIRCIGISDERFNEDALRMLRAIRFSAQLGFKIEEETFLSMKKNCLKIELVSKERIKDELVKIFSSRESKNVVSALEGLRESGLMQIIFPEVMKMFGVEQNAFHSYDVYKHSLETLENLESADYRLRIAAFLHDIGKPFCKKYIEGKEAAVFYDHENIGAKIVKDILHRLKFSNDDVNYVSHFVRYHMLHYTAEWTDGALRRFIKKVGKERVRDWFLLRYADRLATGKKEKTDAELEEFRVRLESILEESMPLLLKDLDIDGRKIMEELGVRPSKQLGDVLSYLLDKVIEEPSLNSEQTLLHLSREYLASTEERRD